MRLKSVLSALGIAIAMVIALDYASFAATGHSALLGKLNKANKVTTFQRTNNGPAVGFNTKAGQPPFTVNRPAKVTSLNADLLDGRDASSFATKETTKVLEFTANTASTSHSFAIGALPAGRYLVTYAAELYGAQGVSGSTVANGICYIGQSTSILFDFHSTALTSGASVYDGSTNGNMIALSGSGVIDTAQGNNATLYCSSNKPFTTDNTGFHLGDSYTTQVTVTKLTSTTSSSLSGARLAAPRGSAVRR